MMPHAKWPLAAGIMIAALTALAGAQAASAAVQNTVSVTITPTVAGGTGTFTQTTNGTGSLAIPLATATGGDGSTATGSSTVNYGQIQLTGTAAGSVDATAMAAFRDNFIITASGVPTGTAGNLTFKVELDGNQSATSGNSTTTWKLQTAVGDMSLASIASGGTGSPESPNDGDFGDPLLRPYSRTVSFEFGMPTPLDLELTATASARLGDTSDAGAASFDFTPAVYWDGIISVRIGTTDVTGVQLTSDSGTNWLLAMPTSETPEPGTAALLAAGVWALAMRRVRISMPRFVILG